MTDRLLSTRNYASNIFQANRHHVKKDTISDCSRWEYVHGKTSVSFLLHWTKAQQALPRCQYLSSKVHFYRFPEILSINPHLSKSLGFHILLVCVEANVHPFRSEDGGSRFLRNVRNPTTLHGVTSYRTVT